MNINNLTINNKLKLLNNSSLKSSENLNGTAEKVQYDDTGNEIIKPEIAVPSKQYENLKNVNIILDNVDNMINNIPLEINHTPFLLLVLNVDSKVVIAKIPNDGNDSFPQSKNSAEFINLPISNTNVACYGNSKIVILQNKQTNDPIEYSTNGSDWYITKFTEMPAFDVCYGNDKFVAVYNYSNNVYYSYDGINWNTASIPSNVSNYWCSVCYGDGKFVAIGNSYNNKSVAYSIDGINWELGINTNISNQLWYSVCYGNGKFVAVHDNTVTDYGNDSIKDNTAMIISDDGITWKEIDTGITASYHKIIYGGGRFYALTTPRYLSSLGISRSIITSSKDGITWKDSVVVRIQDEHFPNNLLYAGEVINKDGSMLHAIYCSSNTYVYGYYFDDDGNSCGWNYMNLKNNFSSYTIDKMIILPAE